jgi:hypothetical protein
VNRFDAVRELVKDPSLRVTDIAKQTGYNKGHVSRLRKEAAKKEWVGLTALEIYECWKTGDVVEAVEAKLKEKNS